MKNINLKKIVPILIGIVIFIVVTFAYFSPLLKGKVLVQGDISTTMGMAKSVNDFRDQYHEEPLWTNSMFSGMPAYMVSIRTPLNVISYVRQAFSLHATGAADIVLTYLFGFFILLLVLKVDVRLSIVGAIAFAFSAFFFILIDAGHITESLAIGYMAPVLAGVILVFRRKYFLGGVVTAFFTALEVYSNHYQITYYLFMLLLVYAGSEIFKLIKSKEYTEIGKSIGVFALAGLLAIGCNISNILNTYDYAKYTIRGKSELTDNLHNKTSGLDRDYVVQWSMGKAETMSLLIPGFKGRSSAIPISENKSVLKELDPQMRDNIANSAQYWGDQPYTTSSYSGAIVVFLFLLGLLIVKGPLKWALLIATILSMMLSWGKNFMPFTDFFLDYVPMYNKFRAVSMILVLTEFAIPILAILALDQFLKKPDLLNDKIKLTFIKKEISIQQAFFIAFGFSGGLSLLFYLMPDLTVFFAAGEYDKIYDQLNKSNGNAIAIQFLDNMELARKTLFKADAIRSFFFITIAAGLVWFYAKSKINKNVFIVVLGVLILADLWMVDKKYINDDNFKSKQEGANTFPETVADKAILEDSDPNYRVLNVAVSTFNDATTSYRHKSIGGYHGAKLRRYQDLIDYHINTNIQAITGALSNNPTDSSIRAAFAQQSILNMLNAKYVIYNPAAPPLQNRYAYGNAWFVNDIKMVKNADEEIKVIGEVNPANTAVVDERFTKDLAGFMPSTDNAASIKLTNYLLNDLKYESNTTKEQLAVFSEIYYEEGWNAYIDGKLTPHVRADYVLRAMRIPAGKHVIEFKFEVPVFYTRQKISLACGLLLLVLLGTSLYREVKGK
jgi:Bacterial membrane protein YfhO